MRFFAGRPARRFLPLAGACGRRGFWAWACARDSRDARVRASAQGGRSASQAKALGTSPGASFLSPLSLAIQRKGARSPPGFKAWGFPAFCVANRGKTYMNGAALLGRALAGGRALAPLGTAPTEIAIANLAN